MVTEPLYSLGEASVPIIMITLGGQLGVMGKRGSEDLRGGVLDTALVIITRMMILPFVALGMIYVAKDHVQILADPTFAMASLFTLIAIIITAG